MSVRAERTNPPEIADERTALVTRLEFLRDTVIMKASGLSDDDARRPVLAPSQMTVAGVVAHLSGVERWWFSIDFAVDDIAQPWPDDGTDTTRGGFVVPADASITRLVDEYAAECARSAAVVARTVSLDEHARGEGMGFDLRYALVHMIEETARHCGHLDLLREHLDGQTGE